MKKVKSRVVLIMALAFLSALLFTSCQGENSKPKGYGLCVNKTSGFPCLEYRCGKTIDNSGYLTATGAEVFDCLNIQFTAPATMTINFEYKAQAWSCWQEPYLIVAAGTRWEKYSFDCSASGNGSISIAISDGLTVEDISFSLSSGDWGSSICIKSITFTP